jgi:hypothetical protein
MSKFVKEDIAKVAMKAVATGAIAGVASLYILKRKDAVEIFGFELHHALADSFIIAFSSLTGDLLGGYAIPYIESKFSKSSAMQNWTRMGLPAILTALTYQAGTMMLDTGSGKQEVMQNLLLSFTSKIIADKAVDTAYST